MGITTDLQSKFCYFNDLCFNWQVILISENIIYDSLKYLCGLISNINFNVYKYMHFVNIAYVLTIQNLK